MSEKHSPIPSRSKITENGLITQLWNSFFNKIFGDIYTRLNALEETKADHEERITTLETP